jgi:RNAse (barnase) inhibitor barstar
MYDTYLKWRALPKNKRRPRSLAEFCQKHNLKADDIKEYEEDPNFHRDLSDATLAWAKEHVPDLIHSLYESAHSSGNVGAIEGFIRLLSEEGGTARESFDDIINVTIFSDEQRKQIIDRFRGRGGFDRTRS